MRCALILSAQKRAERKGFSLTELMVVVAVIVILAGLVAGVVVKAIDASRTSTSLFGPVDDLLQLPG